MSRANTVEREMLELINQERSTAGLSPLQLEQNLNDASEDHSSWMMQTDTFSHSGANGSSAGDRIADSGFDFSGNWTWGENIAWQSERGAEGVSDDVIDLHESLMNSPGHRANILDPDFKFVGIGVEQGDFNNWDAVTVTQNFAATDAAVTLDAEETTAPEEPSLPEPVEEPAEEPVAEAPSDGPLPDGDGDNLEGSPWHDSFEFSPETAADTETPQNFESIDWLELFTWLGIQNFNPFVATETTADTNPIVDTNQTHDTEVPVFEFECMFG